MSAARNKAASVTPETRAVSETAFAAAEAGIAVLPLKEDGTKRPALSTWKSFQKQAPGTEQLKGWYSGESRQGLCFVTGAVSGNLECLEMETSAAWDDFQQRAEEWGLVDLLDRVSGGYCERAPGGGIHLLYRVETPRGNTRLASVATGERPSAHQVLIETRGEGGYIIVAPSHGSVHPTGRPYELLSGRVGTIVSLSDDERDELWALARSFDEKPAKEAMVPVTYTKSGRPGDDFNQKADWEEILTPHHWTRCHDDGEEQYWSRPGKKEGVSATTNYQGSGLLYVFSTSTAFDAGQSYSKFAAYALLNHASDFKAAAKALASQGYGTPDHHGDFAHKLTDLGNAERFVEQHGDSVRYCPESRTWLVWDGCKWESDRTGETVRLAKATARSLWDEALACTTTEARDRLLAHAKSSEQEARIKSMLSMASTEPRVPVLTQDLNADPWLFNCRNGTIDLRTGALHPHRREDLITTIADVEYIPGARSELWKKALAQMTGGDAEVQDFLQRMAGYTLTGDTSEEVLVLINGPAASGKSTFIEAVKSVVGGYARTADFETFVQKGSRGASNDIARLAGARMVVSNEVEEGSQLAAALVKSLTGGDTVAARFLYRESFEFTPQFKLWLVANEAPKVNATDGGIWRRIRRVPFDQAIPEEERDPDVKRSLTTDEEHRSAILAWAVEGCRKWLERGLEVPRAISEATLSYREEANPLAMFIEECCEVGKQHRVNAAMLRRAYENWAADIGERPVGARKMLGYLRPFGIEDEKGTNGRRCYGGLRLLKDYETEY